MKGLSKITGFVLTVIVPILIIWWDSLFKFADEHEKALVAIATILIAVFTIVLSLATDALANLAGQQEKTSKTHERAYIICCGLFGVPKFEIPNNQQIFRPVATDYKPPWRMGVHNHGRTPGFITKIQWGMWLEIDFLKGVDMGKGVDVCKIIDECPNKKVIIEENPIVTHSGEIYIVNRQDVFSPTGEKPLSYRYVQPKKRIVGMYFFAKIDYKDVFRDTHWSTFAMLIKEEHSDTISIALSED